MNSENDYTAKDIQVLSGLEGVRKRPSMYIGDTGKRGLHHLLIEVMDNSLDEAMAGFCTNIEVILKNDGSVSVKDDGRGIPVETHEKTGKSALETVITSLHSGGKFDNNAYKISGGLHGVGLSVVNALSEWMEAEIHRNNKIHLQKYSKGKITSEIKIIGDTDYRGTTIRFKPDLEIFTETEFDYEYLADKFREFAFLNKGLRIHLKSEKHNKEEEFRYEGGLAEFVKFMNKAKTEFHPPYFYEKQVNEVNVTYSFQYTDSYNEMVYSFVNNIKTIEGGTHLVGFKTALTRAINDYLKNDKAFKNGKKAGGGDVLEGLTAVISVRIPDPQFEGQTKTKLGNNPIKGIVDRVVYDSLKSYLEENPDYAKRIMQKVVSAIDAREAAQKAREVIRRKTIFESSILPGKLADCIEKNPSVCELFIVEGDSAGGSCKTGRDRKIQAVLPLRGKILNVEKAPINKVLTSNEIKSIILSLGTGFGDDFNAEKLRYHKIIIACDADVDGAHIRTLLLTLFYRYFKELVERGYIYIAQPPLYKIWKGKDIKYVYSDEEKDKIVPEMDNPSIQRYKGLGEMNPSQLWDTTMDPSTRILKKVTINDGQKADELFTILMGSDVAPRREFIEAYAKEVKDLDV